MWNPPQHEIKQVLVKVIISNGPLQSHIKRWPCWLEHQLQGLVHFKDLLREFMNKQRPFLRIYKRMKKRVKDWVEEGAYLEVKMEVGEEEVLDGGLVKRPVEVLVFSRGLRRSAWLLWPIQLTGNTTSSLLSLTTPTSTLILLIISFP